MTEHENMSDKLGKEPTVLELYHGTSKTSPSDLIDSEEGFDMRFSREGMWGRALYFAYLSSYSHAYSHLLNNYLQSKQCETR